MSFEQPSSQHPVVLVQRPFVDDVVVVFVGSPAGGWVGERPGVQRDAAALRSSLPFVVAGLPLVILLRGYRRIRRRRVRPRRRRAPVPRPGLPVVSPGTSMCFSLSATSSMATSFSCSAGSSKSSLGGLAHGVSGSSIFILACVRRTDGSWTARIAASGRRWGGCTNWGCRVRRARRRTHRLVGLVVAEVILVPYDVLALVLGGVHRARAAHVHVGHGARAACVGRGSLT